MNYRTRSESMLIALVSIPEAIVRLLTLCYVSPRWVDNLSLWSLRRGFDRAKRAQAKKELTGMKWGQPPSSRLEALFTRVQENHETTDDAL